MIARHLLEQPGRVQQPRRALIAGTPRTTSATMHCVVAALLGFGLLMSMQMASAADGDAAATANGSDALPPPVDAATAPLVPAPDDAPFEAPDTSTAPDAPFDPNFNPGFDTSMPEVPQQASSAPARPDYKPPAVDAYVDLALTNTDVSSFTFSDTANGYRFIVGFMLENPVYRKLHIAPEVGYLRIGRAQDQQSTSTNNTPIPQYINTTTTTRQVDMTTLQFDIRGSYPLLGPVEAYARAGMHFYHLSNVTETVLSYTPIPPNTTARAPDPQQTNSSTQVGTNLFGTLGLSCSLGKVPSLYAEYGTYRMGGNTVNIAAFGFLLNF